MTDAHVPPDPSETHGHDTLHQVERLARGSAVLVTTGVVSFVGAFILSVIVARTFGKVAFGLWAIAFSLAQLLSTVGLLGADWIVMRQGSYYEGIGDEPRFRRTIHVSLLIATVGLLLCAAILFFWADAIALSVFHDDAIAPLLRITAVVTPVIGIRQVLVYATQAFKEMKDAALIRNILQPAARLVFVVAAIWISGSVVAAYDGLLVAEVGLLAFSYVVLNRRISLVGETAGVETATLVRFAIPAWASRLAGQSRSQIMPILLGSLAAIATSAVYSASNRIAGALQSVVNSLNQVYTAIGSDMFLQGRKAELAAVYRSAAKWTFTLGAPLLVLMLVFPKELLSLFGPGFREGNVALVILAVGLLFNFGTGPVTVTLIIVGRSSLALVDYFVVIVLEVALAFWLIPRYGLIGGAIAKAVGTTSNNVVPMLQVWWRERMLPFRWDFWKPAASAVAAALVARVVVDVLPVGGGVEAAAVAGLTIGVVYVPCVLLLGLNTDDRAALQALKLRRWTKDADDASDVITTTD